MTCNCDIRTGECQGPNGCQAIAENARLRATIEDLSDTLKAWDAQIFVATREIERLRAALSECAKACYLDEYYLDFRPTCEALVAQAALAGVDEQVMQEKSE